MTSSWTPAHGGHGGDFGPQYHLGCYLRQPLGMEPLILSKLRRKQDPGFRPKVQEIEHGIERIYIYIEQRNFQHDWNWKCKTKDESPKSISLTSPCFNSMHRGGTCLFQWHGQGGTCNRGSRGKMGAQLHNSCGFHFRGLHTLRSYRDSWPHPSQAIVESRKPSQMTFTNVVDPEMVLVDGTDSIFQKFPGSCNYPWHSVIKMHGTSIFVDDPWSHSNTQGDLTPQFKTRVDLLERFVSKGPR